MPQSVRSTRRAAGGAKKGKRNLSSGQVHIFASFNNTIVTVTDSEGNAVAWGSAGSAGFKGSRNNWVFRKWICSSKVPAPGARMRFVPFNPWA